MYADHQCQQKHHALTADGEQEGRYDFTSCLEQHREQEHHAAKGCGVDLPAEHLRTSGDHPGILHEEPHQRPGIQAEDEGQHHGDGDEEGQTEADELAHHVPLFCAVQVTEQWDAAEREANQHQLGDHAHLAGNAHGGNFVVAVGQEELVHHNDSQALHQVAQRGSNTHAQNLLQLLTRDVALGQLDRQAAALFVEQPQEVQVAAQVAHNGGNGRAPCAPAHCGDEDGIEDDIDNRAADAADHGLGGHALAADEVGMDKVQHRGRGTNGQHGVIGLCVRHRLSSRTQNAQQRDAEQHHQGCQHHARGQGHIEAERADPAGALTVVLSQQAGNE